MAAVQGHTASIGGGPSVSRLIARAARIKAVLDRSKGNSYCEGEKRKGLEEELARITAQFGGEAPMQALLKAMGEQAEKDRPQREKVLAKAELAGLEKRVAQLKGQLGA